MIFEPFDLHFAAPLDKFVFFVLNNGVVKDKVLLAFCFKALVLLKGGQYLLHRLSSIMRCKRSISSIISSLLMRSLALASITSLSLLLANWR